MANDTKQTSEILLPQSSSNSPDEKTKTIQISFGDSDTCTTTDNLFGADIKFIDVVTPFQKLPLEIVDSIINQIAKQQRIVHHINKRSVIFRRTTRNKVLLMELRKLQETLYQCTLVSKQFYTISNPLLWQEPLLDPSNGQRFITGLFDSSYSQQQFETLAQHIRGLNLNTRHWTRYHLMRLVPCLTHLNQLAIYGSMNIADTGLIPCLIQHMPLFQHITKLKLYSGSKLTRKFFSVIGRHCRQINELEWAIGENESLEWLSLLVRCPLKSLYIASYSNVPRNETFFRTVQQFRLLSAFYLESLLFPSENYLRLVPSNATQWWNQLTRVKFSFCSGIDDDSFLGFIKSCPRLEHLDMDDPKLLTDKSFDAMAVRLPQLSHLAWGKNQNITPDSIQRLVRGCGGDRLKYIKFTNCALLSECYFTEWALLERGFGFYIVLDQRAINRIKQYKAEGNS